MSETKELQVQLCGGCESDVQCRTYAPQNNGKKEVLGFFEMLTSKLEA